MGKGSENETMALVRLSEVEVPIGHEIRGGILVWWDFDRPGVRMLYARAVLGRTAVVHPIEESDPEHRFLIKKDRLWARRDDITIVPTRDLRNLKSAERGRSLSWGSIKAMG